MRNMVPISSLGKLLTRSKKIPIWKDTTEWSRRSKQGGQILRKKFVLFLGLSPKIRDERSPYCSNTGCTCASYFETDANGTSNTVHTNTKHKQYTFVFYFLLHVSVIRTCFVFAWTVLLVANTTGWCCPNTNMLKHPCMFWSRSQLNASVCA